MDFKLDIEELEKFGSLELLAQQVVEGFITGLHKSPFHGFSVEFSEHRVYNPGENIRHIDWRLLARTDKMFVKRYEDETNLRCQLIIDHSSSMYFPENRLTKMKFAVLASACIIRLLKQQRDAFGLSVLSDEIEFHSQAKSTTGHQQVLYNKLEELVNLPEKNKKTSLTPSLHQLAEMLHKRSLIILFSDMFEAVDDMQEFFNALQHLRFQKHEIIIFNVMDKENEIDFNFTNRPYRFVDIESGEMIKIQPAEIREEYHAKMVAFRSELQLQCTKLKIDLNEVEAGEDLNKVLLPFFVKRNRMH